MQRCMDPIHTQRPTFDEILEELNFHVAAARRASLDGLGRHRSVDSVTKRAVSMDIEQQPAPGAVWVQQQAAPGTAAQRLLPGGIASVGRASSR